MDDLNSVAKWLALATMNTKMDTFIGKTSAAVSKLKLDPSGQLFLHSVLNATKLGGKHPLSNFAVRAAAIDALVDASISFRGRHPDRQCFLATFAWDEGFTWERHPVVDLNALQRRVDKAIRSVGWEGTFVFDIDGFRPITGEIDKRLCFHVHGICVAGDGAVGPDKVKVRMARKTSFPNNLGAPAFHIKPIIDAAADFARVAEYMLRAPTGEKNLVPRRNKPGTFMLRSTTVGMTPASALRLAEIWSHINAFDVIFGVGKTGGEIASDYRRILRKRLSRIGRDPRHNVQFNADIDAEWRSIRKINGSRKFRRCRITTRSRKPG